ncbi:MAG: LytR/AlgR family response regulator transcription factor [Thermoanaerobaculia bacterium]
MSEDVRVLIVDDEEPARLLLREILGAQPGITIVAEADNGFEAVRAASEHQPDVAFLDIEMPKLNGFEVAELLAPEVAVVFVTAYNQWALKAFEIHAADYVLKPYRAERLREALSRARARRVSGGAVPNPGAVSRSARPPGRFAERIVVRDGPKVHVIPVDKVDCLEAQDDYVAVRSDGRKFLKLQTLAALAESLDPARFLRVHRSFVVNLDRLRSIELYAKNSHVALLADGSRIPISREGHGKLKALLEGK